MLKYMFYNILMERGFTVTKTYKNRIKFTKDGRKGFIEWNDTIAYMTFHSKHVFIDMAAKDLGKWVEELTEY